MMSFITILLYNLKTSLTTNSLSLLFRDRPSSTCIAGIIYCNLEEKISEVKQL